MQAIFVHTVEISVLTVLLWLLLLLLLFFNILRLQICFSTCQWIPKNAWIMLIMSLFNTWRSEVYTAVFFLLEIVLKISLLLFQVVRSPYFRRNLLIVTKMSLSIFNSILFASDFSYKRGHLNPDTNKINNWPSIFGSIFGRKKMVTYFDENDNKELKYINM